MWKRIVLAAAAAGLVAGIALTAMQQWRVQPLIRTAEVLEHEGLAPSAQHDNHDAARTGQPPADKRQRLVETGMANIVLGTGFALILAAGMAWRAQGGWRAGLMWAAAGYFVFFVAPAVGLPPELPGMESAPLEQRTAWWLLTVALTAIGLGLVVFGRKPAWRVAGILLIGMPHVIGAPNEATLQLTATHDLASEFVTVTAFTNAIFWLLIGLVVGLLYRPEIRVPEAPV